MCYKKDQKPWTDKLARYDLPPKDDCDDLNPWPWHKDEEGLNLAKSRLAEESAPKHRAGEIEVHGVAEWQQFFRTRILMEAKRYRAAVECGGDADYWTLIDMRFQRVSASLVLWHTSLSVWSDRPRSTHHRPDDLPPEKPRPISSANVERLIVDFRKHSRTGFRNNLMSEVTPMEFRVFDRLYEPPSFLVAVPIAEAQEANRPIRCQDARRHHNNQSDILRKVSNEVLWSHNYESLPSALMKGGINVYRRFFAVGEKDRPRYFLIPDTGLLTPGSNAWRSMQEEATAIDVGILANLEAYAASRLRGIDTRMQILENHLKIYQNVAKQAGTLWDALVRLLPDARGSFLRSSDLENVHCSIEMIHQTLLQGVADLDQLVLNIDVALSQIDVTADELADRFDRELHHPSPGTSLLRDSLRSGYIDRLRRRVQDAAAVAARVNGSYRTLLDTIGLAFDERRVREGDRIQRASVWLATGFGVLGLSGIAQATTPVPTFQYPWAYSVKIFLWVVSLIVLLWVWQLIRNLRSVGQIATPEFENQYPHVRKFLAVASTDYLNSWRSRQQSLAVSDSESSAEWQELDKQLCDQFIEAWEAPVKYRTEAARQDAVKKDSKADLPKAQDLRHRVEEWTLRTLLLTERPRDFSLYSLPRLTCLYRICTARKLKDWGLPDTDSAVGDAELQKVLSNNGKYDYNWFRGEEIHLRRMKSRQVHYYFRYRDFQLGHTELTGCKSSAKVKEDLEYLVAARPKEQLQLKDPADFYARYQDTWNDFAEKMACA